MDPPRRAGVRVLLAALGITRVLVVLVVGSAGDGLG